MAEIDPQLLKREADLNGQIDSKSAQVRNLDNSLLGAKEELDALITDLEAVRDQIMDEFFSYHLYPLGFDYRLFDGETGELLIEIISEENNPELLRLKESVGNQDTSALPLVYIFDFVGESMPFGNL